ncbi:tRNA dihydrouridine synthase DusB [bacterium]|nr:tRNA dihydrouridine synthase DusB [bacterium]
MTPEVLEPTSIERAPIRIGSVEIRNRVLAAPICGASKVPYRTLARRFGADLVYTEMVKAYPLVRGNDRRTLELLRTDPAEFPCVPQICGADEDVMADAARRLEQLGAPLIDINMGCPVPKVVKEGAGAALLREPARVERVVRACASAVGIPVTVKTRSGWDGREFTGIDAARAAEQGGARLITIHARTREQRHGGAPDLASIAAVRAAVGIPVVGNGGVVSAESALAMLRQTGCDAVMVGRGAFGRPWVFREIARAIRGEPPPERPSIDEVAEIVRWHLARTHETEPFRGHGLSRRYVAWYFREAPYGTFFRDRAFRTKDRGEMEALVDEFFAHLRLAALVPRGEAPPVPAFVAERLARGDVPREVPDEE